MDNNNYQSSNTPKQQKTGLREQKKNRVMMAIAVTFTLLLILFTVLLCINLIMEIKGPSLPAEDDEIGGKENPSQNEQPQLPDDGETVYIPRSNQVRHEWKVTVLDMDGDNGYDGYEGDDYGDANG